MQTPLQITLRGIPESAAIEEKIQKKFAKLQQLFQHIISCRVIIDVPQKQQQQGKLYSTHIDLTVPGKEIAVSRIINEDLYVSIRDAFNAARRQLESYQEKLQGEVKHHAESL